MGFSLATACYAAGAKVTLVAGPVSLDTPNGVDRINVKSAMQMLDVSMNQLKEGCDIFIATTRLLLIIELLKLRNIKLKSLEMNLQFHWLRIQIL